MVFSSQTHIISFKLGLMLSVQDIENPVSPYAKGVELRADRIFTAFILFRDSSLLLIVFHYYCLQLGLIYLD